MKTSNLKPVLERIDPEFGSSFTVKRYDSSNFVHKPYWHCHPGYEIIYISSGKGKRYIGAHTAEYEGGDLIFLGPNMPHIGLANGARGVHVEVAVQMEADFLGKDFFTRPEMGSIQQLFRRAQQGLSFFGETKETIGARLEEIPQKDYFARLIELLQILEYLSNSEEFKVLNSGAGIALEVNTQEVGRMQVVFDFVSRNFQRNIALEEIAQKVNMTIPAFCRFMKKNTNKTFTQLVNEFRVNRACELLAKEHYTISAVSFECGYNNLSHFNKQFRLITGSSPSDYRKVQLDVISTPSPSGDSPTS